MTILGLFDDITPAAAALNRLKRELAPKASDMMVLSCAPFPEGVLETEHPPSRLPLMTVLCALIGIALGILLAGGSAALYVLRTGGKPIESAPPIGIIAYEAMMVVALTGAFLTALYEMRLPDWRAKVDDPRIAEGMIGIAIRCNDEARADEAAEVVQSSGAIDVRRDSRSFA